MRDGEESYRITLAGADFRPQDIERVAQQNQLTVTGKRADDDSEGEYLHRGIATRAFERRFQLVDFIEIGDGRFDNGLLSIALERIVPEAMKPHKIAITIASEADDWLSIKVENDGETVDNTTKTGGFGLVGMRERVESGGGQLTFGPRSQDEGWIVHARLPLSARSNRGAS